MGNPSPTETATRSSPLPARHGLYITRHAIERWNERICSRQSGVAPWDLPGDFHEAVPVGIPGPAQARLHPPTQALIVFVWDGPNVRCLKTVLLADWQPFNDDHLKRCESCDLRYHPARGPCPWC